MNEYYLVLVSEDFFGVFNIAASYYPEEFFDNIEYVKKMKSSDIDSYLLDKVGRNVLIAYKYNIYRCMGHAYPRKVG